MSIFLKKEPDLPTPEMAEHRLAEVMQQTRAALLTLLEDDYAPQGRDDPYSVSRSAQRPPEVPDLETATLHFYCGHAQAIARFFASAHEGIETHCFTVQAMPDNQAAVNHVAMTIAMDTTEGKKVWLIDPTFKQFFQTDDGPGVLLQNLPEGETVTQSLCKDGFVALTSERAGHYLSAFCRGVPPFATAAEAMTFLTETPDARESSGLWPPRRYFVDKGIFPPETPSAELRQNVPAAPTASRSSPSPTNR